MASFFIATEGRDSRYGDLAASDDARSVAARCEVERLWSACSRFLDRDVRKRACAAMQQAFWELYLCSGLLAVGLPVTAREDRRKRDQGPDLQIGDVRAWFEAIAVTAGTGDDAVAPSATSAVVDVPDAQIKLRLLSALRTKCCKFEKYVASGLVGSDEPRVVAINAGEVPYAFMEYDPPRIVRSVLPFGWPMVSVDRQTGAFADAGHSHRPSEAKASAAGVATDTFLTGEVAAVSAVLYSAITPYNAVDCPAGLDFVLVHNPTAHVPLPRGFMATGREYWVENGSVMRIDYNADPA